MSKSKIKQMPTQREIVKSIRRPMPPKGKTILSKKDVSFRKRKHKGKTEE